MKIEAQAIVDSLNYSSIINLHDDLVFSGGADSSEAFNDAEERVYDQISDHFEDSKKLSQYIPSPPTQLMLLLKELEHPDAEFGKIQEIIKKDLGLLGEIVRISNSPLYRPRSGEITSIEKAISMLGMRGVMEITSQLLLRRVVDVGSSQYKSFGQFLWSQCLKSAEAGCELGEKDYAFTNYLLGLIHSIGRVVVLSSYIDLMADKKDDAIDEVKIIKHICLEQAPWISTLVAREWDLPENYLNTLEEFGDLCSNLICDTDFDIELNSTRVLYQGSTTAQIHTLIANDKLDQDTGYSFLMGIGLDEDKINGLLNLMDKLDSDGA